nr:hypothetical protein [Raoultella terrigena]
MQTILGASGQIARELARELTHSFNAELRLVSRNPHKLTNNPWSRQARAQTPLLSLRIDCPTVKLTFNTPPCGYSLATEIKNPRQAWILEEGKEQGG